MMLSIAERSESASVLSDIHSADDFGGCAVGVNEHEYPLFSTFAPISSAVSESASR